MITAENFYFIIPLLVLACILFSPFFNKFGLPILILFIGAGMLLGSDGPGGIFFNDAGGARMIGNIALCIILFSGGLNSDWDALKTVLYPGSVLATAGVIFTAVLTAVFAYFMLDLDYASAALFGSIVSSTDAASVFAILQSRSIRLKYNLRPLIEFESSSNDPAAYMLTLMCLGMVMGSEASKTEFFIEIARQLIWGGGIGYIIGILVVWVLNRVKVDNVGLYPVITLSLLALIYFTVGSFNGNSMLGVFVAGLVMGNKPLVNKGILLKYFNGESWLMQTLLFLTLGLLVFPKQLPPLLIPGFSLAFALIFIIRPLVVIPILTYYKYPFKAQAFVSWVGLRGASSIVFAIYPLSYNIPNAQKLFNLVFIIALTSVTVQGALMAPLAEKLGLVEEDTVPKKVESDDMKNFEDAFKKNIKGFYVPEGAPADGTALSALGLPPGLRLVMIKRGKDFLTPLGNTRLEDGDVIMVSCRDAYDFETLELLGMKPVSEEIKVAL